MIIAQKAFREFSRWKLVTSCGKKKERMSPVDLQLNTHVEREQREKIVQFLIIVHRGC